jgi:lipid-A-disaccharide synthase
MKYYLIAGEASGDLHASNLMKEIRKRDPDACFRCWGGDLMQKQGGVLVKHYRDLAFMGFLEVILNLRTITGNLAYCKKDILDFNPDVVILVDYPGFNLRIAKFACESKFRVFYYISPQVWAWNSSRVRTIRSYVDKMFVILPFEKEFYARHDYGVDFIGHPLLDILNESYPFTEREIFLKKNNLDQRPVIALLPGSRKQEISRMLPVMLEMQKNFPDHQFVVAAVSSVSSDFYRALAEQDPVVLITDQTYDLLRNSAAALVTSGTATLETALVGTPQIVCYKGNTFSFMIARMIVHVKYISLVNLIMNRKVIAELIQYEMNRENLVNELIKILPGGDSRDAILNDYDVLKQKLGGEGASAKAASLIIQYLNEKKVR